MARYWFKPKKFGYGATPITWEGWLATTLFAAVVVIGMLELIRLMDPVNATAAWVIVGGFAVLAGVVIGFIRFSEHKTDGEWKWRWGDE